MNQKTTAAMFSAILLVSMFTFFGGLDFADAYNNQDTDSNRANWPSYRGNLGNTGYSLTSNTPRTNNTLWTFSCGQGFGTPAIYNGAVYIGSEYGNLRAVNFSTGAEIWRTHFDGGANTPAIENGVLYVGGVGEVHAVDATTGKVLWTFTMGMDAYYPPAVKNGFVYFSCEIGRSVYALNASNGNKIWNYTTELAVESCPAVVNGLVYLSSADGYVYALAATTGQLVWKRQVDWYFILTSPAVSDGVLYAGSSYFFKFSALNASTGQVIWSVTMKDRIWSSPCVAYGKVFFGVNDGNYYALNASTGKQVWNYTVEGNGENQFNPVVAGGILYACSHDGVVYALNAETGAKIWSYDTNWIAPYGALSLSSPVIANGVVVVGSRNGTLYAFGSPPAPSPSHN